MQTKKREITVIAVILVLQTLIYVVCGGLKSYIHMDEAYSLGLSNYDKVEIQENIRKTSHTNPKKVYVRFFYYIG